LLTLPLRDEYAGIAPYYDAVTARFLFATRRRIAAFCQERGWRRVLDIGCGTGEQMLFFQDAGIRAFGVDSSPAMLAVARRRLGPSAPLARASFPFPFSDASFDAALLSLVAHETDTGSETLLREALRLAPHALILEWRKPERNRDYLLQPLVHCIERLAGQRHYRRFRTFAAQGWLRGLVHRADAHLIHDESRVLGVLTLAAVSKEPGEVNEGLLTLSATGQRHLNLNVGNTRIDRMERF